MRQTQTPMPPTPQSIMRKASTNRVRRSLTDPAIMPPTPQPNTGRLHGGTLDPIYSDPTNSGTAPLPPRMPPEAPPGVWQGADPAAMYKRMMRSASASPLLQGPETIVDPAPPGTDGAYGMASFEEPPLPEPGPIEPGILPGNIGNNLPPVPRTDPGGLEPWNDTGEPSVEVGPWGNTPNYSGINSNSRVRPRLPVRRTNYPAPGTPLRTNPQEGLRLILQQNPNLNSPAAIRALMGGARTRQLLGRNQFDSRAANLSLMASQAQHQPVNAFNPDELTNMRGQIGRLVDGQYEQTNEISGRVNPENYRGFVFGSQRDTRRHIPALLAANRGG